MKELKLLLPYILKYKKLLVWGFVFVTISNVFSTSVPGVVGSTIDILKSNNFVIKDVYYAIAKILGFTVGSGLFMFLTRKTIIVSSRLIEYDLRKDFVSAIEVQDMNFFNTHPTGKLMAYLTNDIAAARDFLGPAIMYGANTITTFAFAMYFMVKLNILMTIFVLLPMPIIAIVVYNIGRKVHIAFKAVQDEYSVLTATAQESFSGIRVIKSYNRQDYEKDKFAEQSEEYLFRNLRLARLQAITMPVLMLLAGTIQILILGFGGYFVIHHYISLGDLTQFFIYLNLLIWPIAAVGWITNVIQRASASSARLATVINSMHKAEEGSINKSEPKLESGIIFRNVDFTYSDDGNKIRALKNINLVIPANSSLGIIGTIGSGKTSLVNLLLRLYDVSSGEILIDDININKYTNNCIRSLFSYVQQDSFLFSMSIKDNISFFTEIKDMAKLEYVSDIAALTKELKTFPEGYETILGERGITLSGGQKQRVAIARALFKDSPVIILDDSLSAVDMETESEIFHNLNNKVNNKTKIVIAHRISTIQNCDQIIYMDKGEIIEKGTHRELIEKHGKYYDLYFKQMLENELENE